MLSLLGLQKSKKFPGKARKRMLKNWQICSSMITPLAVNMLKQPRHHVLPVISASNFKLVCGHQLPLSRKTVGKAR